ncbi:MAG: hypothetical protein U0526_03795 [Candidatus Saccharibacteria bacterium]
MNPNQPGIDPVSETSLNRTPTREAAEFVDLAATATPQPSGAVTKLRGRKIFRRVGIALGLISLVALIGGSVFWLRGRGGETLNPDSFPVSSVGLEKGSSPLAIPSNTSQLAVNGDVSIAGILSLSPEAISNLAATLTNKITLQSTFPGSPQAGNANITGTLGAGAFVGNGARLTNLNASALTTGTVDDARLSANVTRLGQSISLSSLQGNVVSSINGLVNNGGNLDIVGGTNVTVSASGTAITISSVGGGSGIGTITVGSGLTGGGSGSSVNIDLDGAIATLQGNTFNNANQLVQLNGSGALPAVNGSLLTNLNASALTSGTLADARLSANVTVQGNIFNGAAQLVQLNGLGYLPVLNGSNLTSLNASELTSGTVADARLSTNVALKDTQNIFKPTANSNAVLRVQNAAGTTDVLRIDTSNSRVGIGFGTAVPPGYTLDVNGDVNLAAGSAYRIGGVAICTSGGCAPSAGSSDYIQNSASIQASANFYIQSADPGYIAARIRGAVGQTANLLQLDDSLGGEVFSVGPTGATTIQGNTLIRPEYSATALVVQNVTGTINTLRVDTQAGAVLIGYAPGATPGGNLDVNGDTNLASGGAYRIGGTTICDASGCLVAGGSGNYIQNGTSFQTANFAIQSADAANITASIAGTAGQTADIFQVLDQPGFTRLLTVTATGDLKVQPSVDSTTALRVLRSDGVTEALRVDTVNGRTTFGDNGTTTSGVLNVEASGTQTAFEVNSNSTGNLMRLTHNVSGIDVVAISAGGSATFQAVSGSTTAFRIQDAASNTILNVDSTNNRINLGGGTLAAKLGVTTSGSTVGAMINNTGVGDSLVIQKNGAPVLAVFDSGELSIQNSANSSTALGVFNSASGSVLQLATGNGAANSTPSLIFNGSLIGDLSTETTSSPSGALARAGGAAVTLNGYLYHIGGQTSAPADSTTVQYAVLNGNGTTGTFSTTTVLPGAGSQNAGAVVYNGRIYVAQYNTSAVYYTRPNNDGSITSWTTASATIPNNDIHPSGNMVVANGYLYIATGGGANHNLIYGAKINADGSLGSFVTAATLPGSVARLYPQTVVVDGYLVVMGGQDGGGTPQSSVYTFATNTDGTLGAGVTTTSLPVARSQGSAFVLNGYIYFAGGSSVDIYYAQLSASGTITSWNTSAPALTQALGRTPVVVYNGYANFVFGLKNGIYSNTITTMTGARTQLGGTLDLIGISNGTMVAGAGDSGGSVNAGNVSAAGRLQVSGNAQLAGGAVVRNLFQVQGDAAFRATSASSTNTLQVQDSSGATVFNVDAANKAVSIGTATQTAVLTVVSNLAGVNILQITDSTATAQNVLTIADGGATTFRNQTNSGAAFAVQNAAGNSLFTVDTSASRVVLGTSAFATDIKFAGVGQVQNAITRDFTCTVSEAVNDIVVFSAANTVARTTTANSNRVAGVVTNKPGTTTCTTAIAGVVAVWFSSNGAPATIGDPVVTSTVSGAAQSTTTPTTGAMLGNSLSTKDGSNLVWIRLR